jgi:pSer/pThr/pTyr-binding forkhead associated (FHA) protein
MFVEGGDQAFCVRDAGSSNGTFVNNSPVDQTQLQNGDLIRAGKSVFQVTLKEEANKDSSAASQDQANDLQLPGRKLLKNANGDETERYQY